MAVQSREKNLSPYFLVILSFFVIILLGSFLLDCPFAQASGNWGSYIDALFTATSATCVTGLCTYANGIGNELTIYGQAIVLVLIQIGGLGFITFIAFFITLFGRKINFKDRYIISEAVNATDVAHVSSFIRKVLTISISCELIGFALLTPAFLSTSEISLGDAMWYSFFTAVSAFNNAGFDLFGGTSLIQGYGNVIDQMQPWAYYYMCSVLMILIILGGLSFIFIMDIFLPKKSQKRHSLFNRVVLLMTVILIFFGFILLLISETNNSTTNFTAFDALFQSVTCRTAGFAIYDQSNISMAGRVISCILMFIGGSPVSTAGGIKTTTIFLIGLAMYKYLRGRRVTVFNRQFSHDTVLKAMTLVFISFIALVVAFTAMSFMEQNNDQMNPYTRNLDLIYETFSAFGTVGLSADLTPHVTIGSKIVLMILMFVGRLGPMTLLQVFQNNFSKKEDIHFEYAEEDILIG